MLLSLFLLSSCGSSGSANNTTPTDLINDDVTYMTFNLQIPAVKVYEGDSNLSIKLVDNMNLIKDKVETMADKATRTIELSNDLVQLLVKETVINSSYTSTFSTNTAYDLNTPFFAISLASTKHFFLVSSSSRLFVEKSTIKTYFNNSTSLLTAWQRSIENYTSGHLYFNIYELQDDGTQVRVSNSMFIPETKVLNL